MSFELHRDGFSAGAASAILPGQVVAIASGADRQVVPVGTCNIEPFGVTPFASAAIGEEVAVLESRNVVAAIAAASIGRGGDIGVVAVATTSLGPVAAAAGSVIWRVGKSLSAAAAGEEFSLYVNPRQLSGLA